MSQVLPQTQHPNMSPRDLPDTSLASSTQGGSNSNTKPISTLSDTETSTSSVHPSQNNNSSTTTPNSVPHDHDQHVPESAPETQPIVSTEQQQPRPDFPLQRSISQQQQQQQSPPVQQSPSAQPSPSNPPILTTTTTATHDSTPSSSLRPSKISPAAAMMTVTTDVEHTPVSTAIPAPSTSSRSLGFSGAAAGPTFTSLTATKPRHSSFAQHTMSVSVNHHSNSNHQQTGTIGANHPEHELVYDMMVGMRTRFAALEQQEFNEATRYARRLRDQHDQDIAAAHGHPDGVTDGSDGRAIVSVAAAPPSVESTATGTSPTVIVPPPKPRRRLFGRAPKDKVTAKPPTTTTAGTTTTTSELPPIRPAPRAPLQLSILPPPPPFTPQFLDPDDFRTTVKQNFPRNGSIFTPPVQLGEFKFKDYCPAVFRAIRQFFGLHPIEFLNSVCGNAEYIEFLSNSKSGEFFCYSHDFRYMIKTISKQESLFLREILPSYYDHMMRNPHSLLTRFFGMYRVVSPKLTKTHFLLMGSVFFTHFQEDVQMKRVYDLKGSTQGRSVSEAEKQRANCVFKDNDFLDHNHKIILQPIVSEALRRQISNDVNFLRALNIMDYSLLIGVMDLETQEQYTVPLLDENGEILPVIYVDDEGHRVGSNPPNFPTIPEEDDLGDDTTAPTTTATTTTTTTTTTTSGTTSNTTATILVPPSAELSPHEHRNTISITTPTTTNPSGMFRVTSVQASLDINRNRGSVAAGADDTFPLDGLNGGGGDDDQRSTFLHNSLLGQGQTATLRKKQPTVHVPHHYHTTGKITDSNPAFEPFAPIPAGSHADATSVAVLSTPSVPSSTSHNSDLVHVTSAGHLELASSPDHADFNSPQLHHSLPIAAASATMTATATTTLATASSAHSLNNNNDIAEPHVQPTTPTLPSSTASTAHHMNIATTTTTTQQTSLTATNTSAAVAAANPAQTSGLPPPTTTTAHNSAALQLQQSQAQAAMMSPQPNQYSGYVSKARAAETAPASYIRPLEPNERHLQGPMHLDEQGQPLHASLFMRDCGGIRGAGPDCNKIYFVGIIDILTQYNWVKKGENWLKSLRYDKKQISSVSPNKYADRFIQFMQDNVVASSDDINHGLIVPDTDDIDHILERIREREEQQHGYAVSNGLNIVVDDDDDDDNDDRSPKSTCITDNQGEVETTPIATTSTFGSPTTTSTTPIAPAQHPSTAAVVPLSGSTTTPSHHNE